MRIILAAAVLAAPLAAASPAFAAPGDPIKVSDDLTIDPIIDGRLRWEHVDQDNALKNADAVTMRLRAGAEFKMHNLSLLAEAQGTLAIDNDYNAFSFPSPSRQRRPAYSVVADPENVDLNRLQLQYKTKTVAVTIGRQRINLDDQRWVGSVAWRQNEQTFDAVRGELNVGPVSFDGTYSISQHTVFGVDAGPRRAYDGEFILAGVGVKAGPVNIKGFAYVLDYQEAIVFANSSQTYGVRATTTLPLAGRAKLNLAGSYARQSNYASNPHHYSADYIAAEAGVAVANLSVLAGYEKLGADNGWAVQTPMATLHKFNGWADMFLTTPQTAAYAGLQDAYAGAAYKFTQVKALPGLNAAVTYHRFDSDTGGKHYGNEWDASLGFKVRQFAVLAKYAGYQAKDFSVSTRKFWLELDFAY
ncbi:alginate export family protein [Novosphingobium sp.]|uniref:alginate export family protein n=1 Tax=Novosphingobium sp. TaxID=1874826 RepID=UPI002FD880DA